MKRNCIQNQNMCALEVKKVDIFYGLFLKKKYQKGPQFPMHIARVYYIFLRYKVWLVHRLYMH